MPVNYHSRRGRYWPEVERYFSHLPPPLYRRGALLKNNLAIAYTDSGQFQDILSREQDYPLLSLHFWLLDDLADRQHLLLEKHLLLAMVFSFAALYTRRGILDEAVPFDNPYALLEQDLIRQADFHLAHIFPPPAPFWAYYRRHWRAYAAAQEPPPPAELPPTGDKLAFGKIPVAGVAVGLGREELLPPLYRLVDKLNFVFQARQELTTLRRDLRQGSYTYPLARAMQEAGLDRPPGPERLLGAMVLTGTVGKICRECQAHLADCRAIAGELDLPTLAAYLPVVEGLVEQARALFQLEPQPETAPARRSFFAPDVDVPAQAVAMAEGYLLADLTFRESWEVQRGGQFAAAPLQARAFPAGLVIEGLCRQGHALAAQVAWGFEALDRSQGRYYEESPLPPDADDLGLLLRLYRYLARPQAHRPLLQTALRRMEASILPGGEIPVWFGPEEGGTGQPVLIWGHSCAATEINLLLGLVAYDEAAIPGMTGLPPTNSPLREENNPASPPAGGTEGGLSAKAGIAYDEAGYRPIIEKSALGVSERLVAGGLGAALYYPPAYTVWAIFRLLARLRTGWPELAEQLEPLAGLGREYLALSAQKDRVTPQEGALLTLACLAAPEQAEGLLRERWPVALLKSQRYDGSWDDEPLFLTADWRGTAWYSSRLVTTALCYQALKAYYG